MEDALITAAQLDAMTPNERQMVFRQRVVRDISELPDELRRKIRTTAELLAQDRAAR